MAGKMSTNRGINNGSSRNNGSRKKPQILKLANDTCDPNFGLVKKNDNGECPNGHYVSVTPYCCKFFPFTQPNPKLQVINNSQLPITNFFLTQRQINLIEHERKLDEEMRLLEIKAKQHTEERKRIDENLIRIEEQERILDNEKQRLETERQMLEEQRILEADRRIEADRRLEEERRLESDRRLEADRQLEEERRLEEQRRLEEYNQDEVVAVDFGNENFKEFLTPPKIGNKTGSNRKNRKSRHNKNNPNNTRKTKKR